MAKKTKKSGKKTKSAVKPKPGGGLFDVGAAKGSADTPGTSGLSTSVDAFVSSVTSEAKKKAKKKAAVKEETKKEEAIKEEDSGQLQLSELLREDTAETDIREQPDKPAEQEDTSGVFSIKELLGTEDEAQAEKPKAQEREASIFDTAKPAPAAAKAGSSPARAPTGAGGSPVQASAAPSGAAVTPTKGSSVSAPPTAAPGPGSDWRELYKDDIAAEPTRSATSRKKVAIAVCAAAVVLAVVLAVGLLGGSSEEDDETPSSTQAGQDDIARHESTPEPIQKLSASADDSTKDDRRASTSRKKRRAVARRSRGAGRNERSDPADEEKETVAKKTTERSELEKALNGDVSRGSRKRKSSESSPSGGLTRKQVQVGMSSVARSVKSCARGRQGAISMMVTISPNGYVVKAKALGPYAGTPIGYCAANAVRTAKFPKFSGSNKTVKYPFVL